MNDKLTIKDIIFTKALPNYKIPVPTDGYKTFSCTDCGDKFLFESSYEYHINRKSLKISYFCRHCMIVTVFFNRCKLLSHIRSHAFKFATITVADLKIEPLPFDNLPFEKSNSSNLPRSQNEPEIYSRQKKKNICNECHHDIHNYGVTFKDRAGHYMHNMQEEHSCPICMFKLPTVCALEAHLRIHLKIPPYFCPECGMHLPHRLTSYPFDHDCKGFKFMKSATTLSCQFEGCKALIHPDEHRTHFKTHLKKVFRCSYCLEMWYNETKSNCTLCKKGNISSYVQCPLCPLKLFAESLIGKHLDAHCANIRDVLINQSYKCTSCNIVFEQMKNLLYHHVNIHSSTHLQTFLAKFLVKTANKNQKFRKYVYHRVIKKCSKCLRSFTYRCLFENIKKLPNDCPFRCYTSNEAVSTSQSNETNDNSQIECFLCKRKISQNWNNIKVHYSEHHKNHKCLDIQVLLNQLDKKLLTKKSSNINLKGTSAIVKNKLKKNKLKVSKVVPYETAATNEILKKPHRCIVCNFNCENIQDLETHMITHRDPCMAYQCLECGKSFVVKPSFSTHLLLEHGISDVQEYIDKKPCYNELALLKDQNVLNPPVDEPVKENQCRVCREQFETSNELEKHFRVHGMAFLLKNARKKSIQP